MKNLNVTAENFSVIRETLKANEICKVNNKVTLKTYIANSEKVNESGKKTRTPFYYVTENGLKFTSTQLKELLGIETETKNSRKETTFSVIWEQAEKLAKTATRHELETAAKYLTDLAKQKKAEEKKAEDEEIKALEARLKELKAKRK